ncbi:MAG: arylamine N-acetyltransferase [Myxococcales bacterium]|nr:arylamine N-acetyltransferase [Myxococcales bacterium]
MTSATDKAYRRYLSALGWVGDPGLLALVRSHLIKVPFENVGRLLALEGEAPGPLDEVDAFLTDVEERSLGCAYYTANLHVAGLLRFLDYDVEILPAKVAGKGKAHAVLRVLHEDEPVLIDLCSGAPLYEPIPLERDLPRRIPQGEREFVLDRHPLFKDTFELSVHGFKGNGNTGKKTSIYTFKHEPVEADVFTEPAAKAFAPAAKFMKQLRITRFFDSRVLEIRDREFVTTAHNKTSRQQLGSVEELENTVQELMLLDHCPVRRAVEILRDRQGVDLFK